MQKQFRVFSTFTGIGGFEIGIHNAYGNTHARGESETSRDIENDRQGLQRSARQNTGAEKRPARASVTNSIDQRPLFVGYSEIDKPAISVYERHFKGVKNYGDITKINTEQLPDFDCLVGGFPCQAFSIAGRRRGFEDTRGTLFFDLARILRAKRPRLFVFENVKGLLNHDGGRTFATIITTITELGYDAQWQVINSKDFGVPQNRERIIIVGHLAGTPRPEVFPLDGTKGKGIARLNNPRHSTDRVYDQSGASPAISTMQGGGRQPYIKVAEATKKGYAEAVAGQAINLKHMNSKTRRGRVSDVSPTLEASQQIHTLTAGMEIRRLTPLECERLQAFPDDWTKYDDMGNAVSDTQRYKMCGNAVTTNVIQAVFEKIFAS